MPQPQNVQKLTLAGLSYQNCLRVKLSHNKDINPTGDKQQHAVSFYHTRRPA
jgi:hypothetical protein